MRPVAALPRPAEVRRSEAAIPGSLVVGAGLVTALVLAAGDRNRLEVTRLADTARWAVVISVALAVLAWAAPHTPRRLPPPALLLLAGWAWIALVSVVGAVAPIHGVVLGLACVAVTAALGAYGSVVGRERVAWVLVIGLTTTVVLGGVADVLTGPTERVQGLAMDANAYGAESAALVTMAATLGVAAWLSRRYLTVVLTLAAVLVGVGGLVVSESRTASAGALAGVLLAARPVIGRVVVTGLVAFILAVAVGAVLSESSGDLAEAISRTGDAQELTSLNGRTYVWPASATQVVEQPVVGWGASGIEHALAESRLDGGIRWWIFHAHNLPLQLGLAGGFPAVVLVMSALLGRGTAIVRAGADSLDTTLAVVLISGITEGLWAGPTPTMWVLMAAVAIPGTGADRAAADQGEASPLRLSSWSRNH